MEKFLELCIETKNKIRKKMICKYILYFNPTFSTYSVHVEFKFLEIFWANEILSMFLCCCKIMRNNDSLIFLFKKKFLELTHLESTLKMKNLETESVKKSRCVTFCLLKFPR